MLASRHQWPNCRHARRSQTRLDRPLRTKGTMGRGVELERFDGGFDLGPVSALPHGNRK